MDYGEDILIVICRRTRGLAIASRRGGGGKERRVWLFARESGTSGKNGSARMRVHASMSWFSVVDSFGCDGQLLHPNDLIDPSHVDLLRYLVDRPCSDPSLASPYSVVQENCLRVQGSTPG